MKVLLGNLAIMLSISAPVPLYAETPKVPLTKVPQYADTCGTPSSIAGCKEGDCYGGDMLVHGAWEANPQCAIMIKSQDAGAKGAKATAETSVAVKPIEEYSGIHLNRLLEEAISSSTITRGGKKFPLLPQTRSSIGASCELFDTKTFSHVAAIDLESPDHVKKTLTFPSGNPQAALYSPPNADWVIQSYNRVITTAGAPYVAAHTAFPAGYTFNTSGNFSSVQNSMHNFVLGLDIPDVVKVSLNSAVSSMLSNISSYAYSVSGSHGSVQHTAQVWGTGIINTKVGHSWYHGYLDGTLVCAPAYLHDPDALTSRLKFWVNSVVNKLPKQAIKSDQQQR